MLPIPSVSDFIHYLLKDSSTWLGALWPWGALFLGIPLGFFALQIIANIIGEVLDWNAEKEDLLDQKLILRELYGGRVGESMFESWRLREQLEPSIRKYTEPRDTMAGVSTYQFIHQAEGSPLFRAYGNASRSFDRSGPNLYSELRDKPMPILSTQGGLIRGFKHRVQLHNEDIKRKWYNLEKQANS